MKHNLFSAQRYIEAALAQIQQIREDLRGQSSQYLDHELFVAELTLAGIDWDRAKKGEKDD